MLPLLSWYYRHSDTLLHTQGELKLFRRRRNVEAAFIFLFVDISEAFTLPSFIYLQHKVVLFTFEVETQKDIRSLINTKWDKLRCSRGENATHFRSFLEGFRKRKNSIDSGVQWRGQCYVIRVCFTCIIAGDHPNNRTYQTFKMTSKCWLCIKRGSASLMWLVVDNNKPFIQIYMKHTISQILFVSPFIVMLKVIIFIFDIFIFSLCHLAEYHL